MPVTTWLYQVLIIVLLGLVCFFVTCPLNLVLKIHIPMNETKFPTANITRCLISSVSVLQRILEPLNNTSKCKMHPPLYLSVKIVQTHTQWLQKNVKEPLHKKNFTKKIWKCYDIFAVFPGYLVWQDWQVSSTENF